jgi:hypothetical protein
VQFKEIVATDNMDFINKTITEIEAIMDKELDKSIEEMNVPFIDDCICAIEYLQQLCGENQCEEVGCYSADSIINRFNKHRKYFIPPAIACAILVLLCVGNIKRLVQDNVDYGIMNAGMLSGIINIFKNEAPKEETTHESIQITEISDNTETDYYITTILSPTVVTEAISQNIAPKLVGVNVVFPHNMKTEYEKIEELDFSDILLQLTYSNGDNKEIPLDVCTIDIGSPDENGKVRIDVSYEGKSTSFFVVVQSEQEKNPVILNSIYGRFTEGYSVDYMEVVAVYSDSSEKIIPKESCNILTQYSDEFGADIVVVEYGGCSFSFLPQ